MQESGGEIPISVFQEVCIRERCLGLHPWSWTFCPPRDQRRFTMNFSASHMQLHKQSRSASPSERFAAIQWIQIETLHSSSRPVLFQKCAFFSCTNNSLIAFQLRRLWIQELVCFPEEAQRLWNTSPSVGRGATQVTMVKRCK